MSSHISLVSAYDDCNYVDRIDKPRLNLFLRVHVQRGNNDRQNLQLTKIQLYETGFRKTFNHYFVLFLEISKSEC